MIFSKKSLLNSNICGIPIDNGSCGLGVKNEYKKYNFGSLKKSFCSHLLFYFNPKYKEKS